MIGIAKNHEYEAPRGGQQVALVHHKRMVAFLPEMPSAALTDVNFSSIEPVDMAKQNRQAIFLLWHYHQMNVIGH